MEVRKYDTYYGEKKSIFFDMAGIDDFEYKLFAALQYDLEKKEDKTSITYTPTLKIHKDIRLADYGAYNTNSNQVERFTNFTEAVVAYNQYLIDIGEQDSVLRNVPETSPDMHMNTIREGGIGYSRNNRKSCLVLTYGEKPGSSEHMAALIYIDGHFAVVDDVPITEDGKLNLSETYCPSLKNKDLQIALNQYIELTNQPTLESSNISEKQTLGAQEFLTKLTEVATRIAEEQNIRTNYSMSLQMCGKKVADDKIQLSMREVNAGSYVTLNGRSKHDDMDRIDVGDSNRYQLSFSELRNTLKDLGISRVWGWGNGGIDMDFSMIQLEKLKEVYGPAAKENIEYSVESLGESLENAGLATRDMQRIKREFSHTLEVDYTKKHDITRGGEFE